MFIPSDTIIFIVPEIFIFNKEIIIYPETTIKFASETPAKLPKFVKMIFLKKIRKLFFSAYNSP